MGPVASAVARDPSLLTRVLYSFQRIGRGAPEKLPADCELSSIAVRPDASGRRIGKALLHAFLEEAWTKQVDCVSLTTDADSNDFVNGFYARLGFELRQHFEQYRGRAMNEYVFYRPREQRTRQ